MKCFRETLRHYLTLTTENTMSKVKTEKLNVQAGDIVTLAEGINQIPIMGNLSVSFPLNEGTAHEHWVITANYPWGTLRCTHKADGTTIYMLNRQIDAMITQIVKSVNIDQKIDDLISELGPAAVIIHKDKLPRGWLNKLPSERLHEIFKFTSSTNDVDKRLQNHIRRILRKRGDLER